MLKSCRKMTMTVRAGPAPLPLLNPLGPLGPLQLPGQGGQGGWAARQAYTWMDRTGRPVSPPPSPHSSARWAHALTRKVSHTTTRPRVSHNNF